MSVKGSGVKVGVWYSLWCGRIAKRRAVLVYAEARRWLFGASFGVGLHGFGCKAAAAEEIGGLGRGVVELLGVLRP